MKYKITIKSHIGHIAINHILRETIKDLFSSDIAKVSGTYRKDTFDFGYGPSYQTKISIKDERMAWFDIDQVIEQLKADKWINDVYYKVYTTSYRALDSLIDAKPKQGGALQLELI